MIDAALAHQLGKSNYDYRMYVLVHQDAAACAQVLEYAGYTVKILPQPVEKKDIRGVPLRKAVDCEWCGGSKEFIKLFSYTLVEHPIVVHVDIDFAFFRPMDELFDAMLDSTRRDEIVTQYPFQDWPSEIEAFITRDYQQEIPGITRSPLSGTVSSKVF